MSLGNFANVHPRGAMDAGKLPSVHSSCRMKAGKHAQLQSTPQVELGKSAELQTSSSMNLGNFANVHPRGAMDAGKLPSVHSSCRMKAGKYAQLQLTLRMSQGKSAEPQTAFDGVLGDRFAVNGAVQPYCDVKARKYRFRFLDAGPSRWYHLAITDGKSVLPLTVIANDGNLFEAPITMQGINISVAERFDIVFDFKDFRGKKLYLINRMEQKDGRGPTGNLLSVANSTKLVEFRVANQVVADPSQVPSKLRPQPTINLNEVVRRRKFKFDRTNGAWSVNGQFFDGNLLSAAPQRGTAEIWELEGAGGWSHPVHIHFEEGRILTRNGKTPPPHERGRKDVYPLLGSEKVEVFLRFRDYVGKYVTHCHNTVHEDHAMMFRWDITDTKA